MSRLDRLYLQLLKIGLLQLRAGAREEWPSAWMEAVADYLHNIPSLIAETNGARHRYFWEGEKECFRERVARFNSPDMDQNLSWHQTVWNEMDAPMREVLASKGD